MFRIPEILINSTFWFVFVAKSGNHVPRPSRPATDVREWAKLAEAWERKETQWGVGGAWREGITQPKKQKKLLSPTGKIYYFKKRHFPEILYTG